MHEREKDMNTRHIKSTPEAATIFKISVAVLQKKKKKNKRYKDQPANTAT
jgi:hypothetical protein